MALQSLNARKVFMVDNSVDDVDRSNDGQKLDDETDSRQSNNDGGYEPFEDEVERQRIKYDDLDAGRKEGDTSYRGFATSFSSSFLTPEVHKIDLCSFVCCGLLQRDRNIFLLTRREPPSCMKRIWMMVIAPFFLCTIAYYIFFFMPNMPHNTWIALGLIGLLLLHGSVQLLRAYRKRVAFRRELLWRKYCRDGTVSAHPSELDSGDHAYMMGQTASDINMAHKFCGCYRNDTFGSEHDHLQRPDLCSRLWQVYRTLCCGMCGYTWQCCGVCAIAQEARELNKLVSSHRLQVDIITMQPVIEYYSKILYLRHTASSSFIEHWRAISLLSLQLCWGLLFFVTIAIVANLLLLFPYYHILIIFGVFLFSFITLFALHWPFNKHHMSLDLLIKSFAAGFCIATSFAFLFEAIEGLTMLGLVDGVPFVQGLVNDLVGLWDENTGSGGSSSSGSGSNNYVYTDDGGVSSGGGSGDDQYQSNDGYNYADYTGNSLLPQDVARNLATNSFWMWLAYVVFHSFFVAIVEEISKYLVAKMTKSHPDYWSTDKLKKCVDATTTDTDFMHQQTVAAARNSCIEANDRSIKSRGATIMVNMIAIALGFECCETLLYVFFYSDNSPDLEMGVLIARAFLPIQAIAAAWQAIRVCQRDLENKHDFGMGKVILPAVLYHGTFDLLVLVVDRLNDEHSNLASQVVTLVVAALMVIGGIAKVTSEYNAQQKRLDRQCWIDMASSSLGA